MQLTSTSGDRYDVDMALHGHPYVVFHGFSHDDTQKVSDVTTFHFAFEEDSPVISFKSNFSIISLTVIVILLYCQDV